VTQQKVRVWAFLAIYSVGFKSSLITNTFGQYLSTIINQSSFISERKT